MPGAEARSTLISKSAMPLPLVSPVREPPAGPQLAAGAAEGGAADEIEALFSRPAVVLGVDALQILILSFWAWLKPLTRSWLAPTRLSAIELKSKVSRPVPPIWTSRPRPADPAGRRRPRP